MLQTSGMQSLREMTPPGMVNEIALIEPAKANPGLAPWRVSEFRFPYYGEVAEKLAYCVRYAILAPSSHNTQPWRFTLRDDRVELYADRTRNLPVIDPDNRELIISCGAALANLCVAIRHFGYEGDVSLCPQPNDADLVATVGLGRQHKPTCHEENLFKAITTRRTNRSAYEDTPISLSLRCELHTACKSQGVWLTETSEAEEKRAITELVAEGDRQQMASAEFRAELADWIRPAGAESHDGMPCYAQNIPKVRDFAAPIVARVIRTFDMGDFTAARDADLANASAVLAVLSTQTDSPADWLATGVALEHALLNARAAGVWASFLNQPVEIPELRLALAKPTGCPGIPQILLRMGYGRECEPTPRRGVDEVLNH
jgi:hypothetical protein